MQPSLPESFQSVRIPPGAGYWRKLAAFAGPGYLVAVGYMDPGNWATDIAGGSAFGYALLPAILASGLVAMFLQWLALRLGIGSGMDLAQACRARFPRPVSHLLWVTCEIAIIACDLAEVIGTAIALNLLFKLPMALGVLVTAVDTLLLITLQKRGFRYLEALVISLLVVVACCFALEMTFSHPAPSSILKGVGGIKDVLRTPAMLYIALGIFGATVMPHNLYLHSSIAQTRQYEMTEKGRREAIHFSTIDSTTALSFALLINAAILILAAAVFYASGHKDVAGIEDAYKLLAPLLGVSGASILFALALLASGQNSTLTGTMAGQIVMEGFLNLRISPAVRRLVTRAIAIVPALAVIIVAGAQGAAKLLVFSQVVLSLQLGFAVIPLVMFTGNRDLMGAFANPRPVQAIGYGLCIVIVGVNAWLVIQTFR